jgi:hypothetical protein
LFAVCISMAVRSFVQKLLLTPKFAWYKGGHEKWH